MTRDELRQAAEAAAEQSASEQGLAHPITDTGTLDRVAAIVHAAEAEERRA